MAGMYIAYADKLLNFTEQHAQEIAKQWTKALMSNPKTTAYKKVREFKLVNQGESFYKSLKRLYFEQNMYDVAMAYFSKFAEEQFYENIPLDEAIYAVMLLRRQMWLFAEFQVLFTSALDQYQASDGINRTVLLTDYGIIAMVRKYNELRK
jgi:tetratricopeptide (TPR) repeat protein